MAIGISNHLVHQVLDRSLDRLLGPLAVVFHYLPRNESGSQSQRHGLLDITGTSDHDQTCQYAGSFHNQRTQRDTGRVSGPIGEGAARLARLISLAGLTGREARKSAQFSLSLAPKRRHDPNSARIRRVFSRAPQATLSSFRFANEPLPRVVGTKRRHHTRPFPLSARSLNSDFTPKPRQKPSPSLNQQPRPAQRPAPRSAHALQPFVPFRPRGKALSKEVSSFRTLIFFLRCPRRRSRRLMSSTPMREFRRGGGGRGGGERSEGLRWRGRDEGRRRRRIGSW